MAAAYSSRVVKNGSLVVLLLLFLLLLQGVSGFVSLHGGSHVQNRKVQADLKGSKEEKEGSVGVGWELRTVPSGPEPLHHHGGKPKKPRTDP